MAEKKDNNKQNEPKNRFRKFMSAEDLFSRSASVRTAVAMLTKKANNPDSKNAELAKSVFQHSMATANFCYEYYNAYIRDTNTDIDLESLYTAAIYFNYYKLTTDGAENRDLSLDELHALQKKKNDVNSEIRRHGKKEVLRYLFVKDDNGQMAHEIIFTANAIDNLMCIKNSQGNDLSLSVIFSILSSSGNFDPKILKNFENMFIQQVKDGAEEYKISFASKDEKRAFSGLDKRVQNMLFTVISMVLDNSPDNTRLAVDDLKDSGNDSQLIVFTSDPEKPQQFYDKRTNTLYTI